MTNKLILLLVLSFFCLSATAQKKEVSSKKGTKSSYRLRGYVADGTKAFPDVTIRFFLLPDTTFVEGCVTDKDGRFDLRVPLPGSYLMKASFVGYETVEKKVGVAAYDKNKYVGYIRMQPASIELDEMVIKAELQKMKMSGDTLVYNTGAFKTSEGAVLQDLVRQLPGVELDAESGKIKFNGKEVTKILLNGKEFFADKKVALDNMPVDALKEVKMYEQKSDKERMTGVEDGKKETVMDVKTKKSLADGLMGNVSAKGGTEDLYGVKVGLNKFGGKLRMSLNGDLNKLPSSQIGWMNGGPDVPRQRKGVNLSLGTEWKKLNINSYFAFDNMDSHNESRNESENYLPTGSQFSFSKSGSTNDSRNFNGHTFLRGTLSDKIDITGSFNIGYNKTDANSANSSATFSADPRQYTDDFWGNESLVPHDARINSNKGSSLSKSDNLFVAGNAAFTYKLNDIGRNLSWELQGSYGNRGSDNFQQSSITYYQVKDWLGNDSLLNRNQYRESPSKNSSVTAEVSFTEPIGKQMLQVYYRFQYQKQSSDSRTFNLGEDTPWGTLPDGYENALVDSLSDYTRNHYYINEVGVRTTINWEKARLSARLGVQPQKSTTRSDRGRREVDTTVTVLNFRPELQFNYDIKEGKRFYISYGGSTGQPSIYDLLPVPDYTNPLYITMGNPGLKPSFTHYVSTSYTGGNVSKQEMFSVGLGYNGTMNAISRKVLYDEESGVRTSRPENINGNWALNGHLSYNNKLFKKISYRLMTNASFNHQVAYVQVMGKGDEDGRNVSGMLNLSQFLELAYRLDEHEFKLNGNITYQHADNSYMSSGNYETYDYYYGAECRLKLPLDLKFYTVFRSMNRRGYKNADSNTTQWLWNGELSYSFLKGKKGLLSLQVMDILQQRSFVNRWMNADGQGELWTKGLGRYVLCTFTYRFNNLSR